MKTFTQISISLAMTLGLSSVALAGDAKAPTPAPTPAKKEEAKKEAPKKMEPMKAPQELADMGKAMVGTWKCTGKAVMDPTKPTEMTDMKMTVKMSMDMGGWWIKSTMDAGAMFKGEEYVTYDSAAKKYISIMRDSMGASEMKTSMGMKDNKIVWEGDARSSMPGMTAMKSRATSDMSDAKAGVKMMGEYSMDGKTWMKAWEAACKK
ncbi:MAG: DUF1579 family protein [Myxococcales bacterium]|nr:DUF1579 family protein [Myxococcales bacterium]